MQASQQIVRSEVTETTFNLYSDVEKANELSVCRIDHQSSLDSNGKAIPGGLYDERMGPVEMTGTCQTCSLRYASCPGHPGHIELDVPVYYPVLFPALYQLLRCKCLYCHKLRMSQAKVRYHLVKLKLLEIGDVAAAMGLQDMIAPPGALQEDELESGKGAQSWDAEQILRRHESRYTAFVTAASRSKRDSPSQLGNDPYTRSLQAGVIDAFQRAALAVKGCENCGAHSPPLRKDGFTKIFQRPTPKRLRASMRAKKLKLRTGMDALRDLGVPPSAGLGGGGDSWLASSADVTAPSSLSDSDDSDSNEMDVDSEDIEAADSDSNSEPGDDFSEADRYLVPVEVEAQMRLLWRQGACSELLDFIWLRALHGSAAPLVTLRSHSHTDPKKLGEGGGGWRVFFSRVVLVPASRFRPPGKVGDIVAEHPQNTYLKKVLIENKIIRDLYVPKEREEGAGEDGGSDGRAEESVDISKVVGHWIELQGAVNCFMDSAKDGNVLAQAGPAGIRQLLERKEGLFRRHMMGKRVNFCCRSVISPDPYIGTNEIGIPVQFAKSLHYPTPVNEWNVKHLRTLVQRGPFQYPGANQIEMADGRIIKLDKLSDMERAGKAKLLLSNPGIKVHRHLIDGDVLLVNRQPTLHKPGIMAHKARVLRHVKEQTLRMHYANCNTYNADFDGDEMNCHFVQSELARAEANFICNTDNQYIGPTDGAPLRGLIQDHVASAVKLTCKDTFLTKAQFQQLLFVAVCGLPGTEIVTHMDSMQMPQPAVWRPQRLWTGKQVVTALIAHLCRPPLPPLNLDSKTKTPPSAFGEEHGEHEVIFRNGELLSGVLDKAAIGASSLGIVHTVYELYGAELAGRLLSAVGRVMTCHLQGEGHSCGIQDLTLSMEADAERRRLLKKVAADMQAGLEEFCATSVAGTGSESGPRPGAAGGSLADRAGAVESAKLRAIELKIAKFVAKDRVGAKALLDSKMQSVINQSASSVIKACLPAGLEAPFLRNNFSMMVMTGAKGSSVNQSQVSCFLGQQALEGQRVPLMVSGKSLPSFRPFEASARAGGFVQDRFLTGVKPQEYYFHCMAGREGLVDTAVKTSRSGYLQRCLVKHLEELRIGYDMTVRDSASNVVQFLYGEDGLDPTAASLLKGDPAQMRFLARNTQALCYKHSIDSDFLNQGMEIDTAEAYHKGIGVAKRLLEVGGQNDISHIEEGSVVSARRKKHPELGWERPNLRRQLYPATVQRVRKGGGMLKFDLQYADGTVEKKVPGLLMVTPRPGSGGGVVPTGGVDGEKGWAKLPVNLVRPGVPDPALSALRLDSCLGAVSESLQDKVREYVQRNADGLVGGLGGTEVHAESLQLLVWVKYLRSLACPGEAVGCVAAQSVGEPSTQMTLNTFHLAGHGGANVTLGIPRLREIIMTASKNLKTPTMYAPMMSKNDTGAARDFARKLSRLSLSELLSHQGGVHVGEQLSRTGGRWERNYRIRLCFERPERIQAAFGVSFDMLVGAVKGILTTKLDRLIKLEQRRAGDSTAGGLVGLRGAKGPGEGGGEGGGDEEGRRRKGSDMGAEDVDPEDLAASSGAVGAGGKGRVADASDEDDSDDDGEAANDEDLGNLKLSGAGKEVTGYDDDDEEEQTEDKGKGRRVRQPDDSSSEEDIGDDDGNEKEGVGARDSVVATTTNAKKQGKSPSKSASKRATGSGKAKASGAVSKASLLSAFRRNTFRFDEVGGWVEVELSFHAGARRLLMAQLAEEAARQTMVRSTKHITNAFQTFEDDVAAVVTEGVNFEALWSAREDLVDVNNIMSNDIYQLLNTYGVEAARQSIVGEINNVFGVYGIKVDPRHLSLIADFMTRNGTYTPLNRAGMLDCPSPLLRMSFESTCTFLTRAAQEGQTDNMQSPSARIVLGTMAKVGTGCFDLMLPLTQ